jgi:hypothetical protein
MVLFWAAGGRDDKRGQERLPCIDVHNRQQCVNAGSDAPGFAMTLPLWNIQIKLLHTAFAFAR